MVWVIAMMVLEQLMPDVYPQVLVWSVGCWKDCLRLARTVRSAEARPADAPPHGT
jgi:hypothetical protein